MTETPSETLFRQVAEAAGGMPVSAGARVAHVRAAVESGSALFIDLSGVPEDKRAAVIAEIKELVTRANTQPRRNVLQPAPDALDTSG
jgi:hypothetical protein